MIIVDLYLYSYLRPRLTCCQKCQENCLLHSKSTCHVIYIRAALAVLMTGRHCRINSYICDLIYDFYLIVMVSNWSVINDV